MGLVPFFSTPSARMGIMWTFSSVKGLMAVEFGPAGTTNYLSLTLPKLNAQKDFSLFTTHIEEKDIVLGDTTRLKKAVLELEQRYHPEFLFILQSAAAAVIGVDLESFTEELQESVSARLVYVSSSIRKDWTWGVESALTKLAEVFAHDEEKKPGTVNLIGSCIDEYQYQSDTNEAARMMKEYFGFETECVMTGGSHINDLKNLGKAQCNLVLRKEGIQAAQFLEKRFGTPYLYFRPYGPIQTKKCLESLAQLTGQKWNKKLLERDLEEFSLAREEFLVLLSRVCPKHTVVAGSRNVVEPMCLFLKEELYLSDVRGFCNSKRWADENIPYYESPLSGQKGCLMLCDGISASWSEEPSMQVSNPNENKKILFSHTPFLGIRGAVYLIQEIYRVLDLYDKSGKSF